MRIGAQVDAAGEVEIGRQLVEGFVAEEGFAGAVPAVVGRGFGEEQAGGRRGSRAG